MKNLLVLILLVLIPFSGWGQSSTFSLGKLYRINNVEFSSRDGFPLKATIYHSTEKNPGILLFHVMGVGQRFDYESLATQLAMQGFNILAVDLRGHGESRSEQPFEYSNETLAEDEDAALEFLQNQPNVIADRIGVIGASGTVAEAIGLAKRHKEVQAIAGLSGHADEAGLNFLTEANHLAILGIGAKSDTIMTKISGDWKLETSAETMRRLVEHSTNLQSQLMVFEQAPHGTAMLEAKMELTPMLTAWFANVLLP
ncbi:MAG: alpha/beta hydrolase [Saprospiraceae bacterium]|nr:alpha/beta hydrolase [Saprospiraceae bacterium]